MTPSLPVGKPEPRRHYVGEILGTQPAVKRVSRNVAYRGYRVFICAGINEAGEATKTTEVFKPSLRYDRGVVNPSKYVPHQGAQECIRRNVGGWAFHKRMGEFYGADGAPHTKRSALPYYLKERAKDAADQDRPE